MDDRSPGAAGARDYAQQQYDRGRNRVHAGHAKLSRKQDKTTKESGAERTKRKV
jgi:hypothetical protein